MATNNKISVFTLIAITYFYMAPPTMAMSRHHEGEANIWVKDKGFCLGVDTHYQTEGYFFSRNANVDENEVRLDGISISRNDDTYVWATYSQDQATLGPRLTSTTCIPYGEEIQSFNTETPAIEIKPGIYSIMLISHDQKGRRASFYTVKCITGSPASWSIAPVKINEKELGATRWYCD
ncbi:hypothetical protein [Pseudomonas sp. 5P_3.1_Bac2]|uniref:hypothetical protein n=1 Tax=Pseudomonas sp. 5P_3.1_Bac2 TaxID=2971617 RepID=UPI0021C7B00A|nr:hypothetical protein [Pseudomonas sp. 5P_3.1_Bac2]MCU1717819.1 hypothetical protein [Pseudomonas sp. 5P_3.1_Bac2]